MKREIFVLVWAAISLTAIGFVAPFGYVFDLNPPTTVTGFILHMSTVLVVGGFYVYMFAECFRAKSLRRRFAWILLFVVVPILSAHIYFVVTRSRALMS